MNRLLLFPALGFLWSCSGEDVSESEVLEEEDAAAEEVDAGNQEDVLPPSQEPTLSKCERDFKRFSPGMEPDDDPAETLYYDPTGQTENRILASNPVHRETVDFYFEQVAHHQDRLLEFYGITSFWKNRLAFFLVEPSSSNNWCAQFSYPLACGLEGKAVMTSRDIENWDIVNDMAAQARLWEEGVFVHELSHALRSPNLHLFSKTLEEGAAVYAEQHLVALPRLQKDFETFAGNKAKKLFEGVVSQGDQLEDAMAAVSENERHVDQIFLSKVDEDNAVIDFTTSFAAEGYPDPGVRTSVVIPLGRYTQLGINQLLAYVEKQEDGNYLVKIYRRGLKDIGSGSFTYDDTVGQKLSCAENGYYKETMIALEDALVSLHGHKDILPFSQESTERTPLEVEKGNPPYYPTGFCFFEGVRNMVGHEGVQDLFRAQEFFFHTHQGKWIAYPYFEYFQAITNMNEEDATNYFNRFGVPIDAEEYKRIGICWSPE